MTTPNPYQAPKSDVGAGASGDDLIERIASGQKLIIQAILINVLSVILQLTVHPTLGLIAIVSLVLSIVGIVKLATGLGTSLIAKIFYIILMFLPLINMITLLILNSRATTKLRAHGYKVGLMGASKPD